jgi:hypothetical protein
VGSLDLDVSSAGDNSGACMPPKIICDDTKVFTQSYASRVIMSN